MDIDDLLKKSFEQPSFVYKDDYWQAASAKLDQHFRRKFYIQISMITLLLIIGSLLSYLIYSGSVQKLNWFQNKDTSQKGEILASSSIDRNNVSINSDENISEPDNLNFPTKADKSNPQNRYTEVPAFNYSNKLNSSESINSIKTTPDSPNLKFSESLNKDFQDKEVTVLIVNNITPTLEQENPTILSDQLVVDYDEDNFLSEESKPLENDFMPLVNLKCLELPFNLLMEQEDLKLRSGDLVQDIKPISRKSYLEYGIIAEISTYPKFEGDNKNLLGGNAGLDLSYHFNNNFLLRSGLNIGYRGGSFSPSVYSTQKSFLLGPQEDAFVFRPTGLVSITLPLQLGYKFDKYTFGFGINNHFLAATYGNLEYAESDFRNNAKDKPFEEYTLIEKGWLSNAGLRRFVNSYQISVHRTIYDRLSAGINLQYFPKDWTTESYGQVYSFEAGQYINPTFDNSGLTEKNWIVNFNIYFRL